MLDSHHGASMVDSKSDYTSKLEIELVKRDVTSITKLCERIDGNVEDMKKLTSDISRLVSLQEQKIKMQEDANKDLEKAITDQRNEHDRDVNDLSNRINTVNRDLTNKIDQTETVILSEIKTLKKELTDSIGQINTWRYMVIGGTALAVFLISNFASKLFR
jgi:chromosome segregation ATPase